MKNILLSIVDAKKVYGHGPSATKALNGVSFDIYEGEIIGLLGVNGAGKTTLSSILASISPLSSGSITMNGASIYEDITKYRRMVGFCPQKINLDNDLSIEQNLLYAGRYMGIDGAVTQERTQEFMRMYALTKYRDQSPSVLSGGYARRLLIARALMHEPKFVILDEPTVGLDPHVRHQLWETIRDLKAHGVSVVLTTHYIDEAEFLSDRIVVLDKGKVRLIDTPQGLKTAYDKSRLEDVFIQLIEEDAQQA